MKASTRRLLIIGAGAFLMFFNGALSEHGVWGLWPEAFKDEVSARFGGVVGLFIILALWVGESSTAALAAGSPFVLAQSGERFRFNPHDGALVAGQWLGAPLGGIDRPDWNFTTSGGDGAVFAMAHAWRKVGGRCKVILGKVERVPFEELPPEVKDRIKRSRVKPPYYIATAPLTVEMRGNDVAREWRQAAIASQSDYFMHNILKRHMNFSDTSNRGLAEQLEESQRSKTPSVWDRFKVPKRKKEPDAEYRREDEEAATAP